MKVSVIIPCYNAEKYIGESINSVLTQNYSNFELIIVDDGSTDNSVNIVKSFDDKRIRLISQKNSGKPSIPRNKGMKNASGELLCFLDADDLYLTDRLEKAVNIFIKNPDISYVYGDQSRTDEDLTTKTPSCCRKHVDQNAFNRLFKQLYGNSYFINPWQLYLFSLFVQPLIDTNSITIRLSSFDLSDLLFNESVVCTEDLRLWNFLMLNSRGIYLDEVLSIYRNSNNSVTDNIFQFEFDSYKYIRQELDSHCVNLNRKQIKILKDRATLDLLSAAYWLSKSNIDEAKKLYAEAIQFNPNTKTIQSLMKCYVKWIISKFPK